MATPTNRPSFDRKKAGLNPSAAHFRLGPTHAAQRTALTPNKGENQVTRKKVLLATATIKHPNLTQAQIDASARFCYEFFVRDVGYANCTRFCCVRQGNAARADGLNCAPKRRSRGLLIRGWRLSAPPTSPDCHQQTIDVGRRASAARCPTERRTSASRSWRTPQVDLACPSLSTASRCAKRAMP